MWRWASEYDLALKITNALASVLFSNGQKNRCLVLVEEMYAYARCQEDKQDAQFLRREVLACMSRLPDCIDVALDTMG
jgi:hypothetical protein